MMLSPDIWQEFLLDRYFCMLSEIRNWFSGATPSSLCNVGPACSEFLNFFFSWHRTNAETLAMVRMTWGIDHLCELLITA